MAKQGPGHATRREANTLYSRQSRVTRAAPTAGPTQPAHDIRVRGGQPGCNSLQSRPMAKNILVVNAEGPETRVAVVENGVLAELYVERKHDRGMVGNIYRGKVTRVLPGMQAAFVDLGPRVERAAFLYVGDVLGADDGKKLFEDVDAEDGDEATEGAAARLAPGKKALANRKIEDLLKLGQEVLCQVVKDPIALKGARVTGYLSLPGRYSVYMPAVSQIGVSRRIASDKERKRL